MYRNRRGSILLPSFDGASIDIEDCLRMLPLLELIEEHIKLENSGYWTLSFLEQSTKILISSVKRSVLYPDVAQGVTHEHVKYMERKISWDVEKGQLCCMNADGERLVIPSGTIINEPQYIIARSSSLRVKYDHTKHFATGLPDTLPAEACQWRQKSHRMCLLATSSVVSTSSVSSTKSVPETSMSTIFRQLVEDMES